MQNLSKTKSDRKARPGMVQNPNQGEPWWPRWWCARPSSLNFGRRSSQKRSGANSLVFYRFVAYIKDFRNSLMLVRRSHNWTEWHRLLVRFQLILEREYSWTWSWLGGDCSLLLPGQLTLSALTPISLSEHTHRTSSYLLVGRPRWKPKYQSIWLGKFIESLTNRVTGNRMRFEN